ncbi:DNA mismatch repair protein MutT [Rhodovulum sulfidophilum]|uniref:NUDIX hydrolase n=1 Tax=Rhodovulum visakhapatnamense TaxID=364297 RepID=A0ABS1RG31_9RHOB|nr:NUDIX hydrolase [Rhodovulum visakhapatnamense]MBL3569687.1 NUDIX hydrolase [Rhodovulum visakhapatnamense]MBL3578588.1 NUDIX hydrolase [Rhodovulum visakhapatnamense]OLS44605.1 DNA mismatch repair protein MutT [Rhodovulum sulfidophilum]
MGETDARLRPAGGIDDLPIRDAATVIVVRDAATGPRVLMGQRGESAAFMPNKVVFPGGAVDAADGDVPLACPLSPACARRLTAEADPALAGALAAAAIRELWEETGLILGRPGAWPGPAPKGWRGFAASGHLPSPEGFHFIFRAITPPGRPRRFDARFFLVEAEALASDPDDFSRAEDELSQLQWIPLAEVRRFNLPFITEVVLAEVSQLIRGGLPPASVPFFDNRDSVSRFQRLA